MSPTRKSKIDVLGRVKTRNDKSFLDVPRIRSIENRLAGIGLHNIRAGSLGEFSGDIGDARLGPLQISADGTLAVYRLAYLTISSTAESQQVPTITLPRGIISHDNIVRILVTGYMVQNVGSSQTVRVKIYLGKQGSEIDVSFPNTYTVGNSTSKRPFEFFVDIYSAPDGSLAVLTEETFTYDNQASLTNPQKRQTQTNMTGIESLDEIDSVYITFTMSTANSFFQVATSSLRVHLYQGTPLTNIRWTDYVQWRSQPIGSNSYDTYINTFAPTTNYYTNENIFTGESTGGANVTRCLLKFPAISNIPENALVNSVNLYLVIKQNLASNARTVRAFRMTVDWDQTTCTWNKKNATDNWTGAGAAGDYDSGTELGNISLIAAETIGSLKTISLSATEFQKFIDGTYDNYGIILVTDTEAEDAHAFYSGNPSSVTYEPLAPMLEVIYSIPS